MQKPESKIQLEKNFLIRNNAPCNQGLAKSGLHICTTFKSKKSASFLIDEVGLLQLQPILMKSSLFDDEKNVLLVTNINA